MTQPAQGPDPQEEIAAEQQYVDRLYQRLDQIRTQIGGQLSKVQRSQHASTHQNRSERDAFAAMYQDRLALLDSVSNNVVFGRLDGDDQVTHYIGRIGLFTPDRHQLLVDWRAPAAAAFYQATPAARQGVRLRRHLVTRGRTVVGLEDDVLDSRLLEDADAGSHVLQGEGALLASLRAQRTGRMGEIVATIQAEQDRIIRAKTRGVLIVQGGPGTGKTAVALHRAAYLLYTHRRKLEHSGVLVVAPTRGFLRYIERVLPSLGESGVLMLTPGELFPGVSTELRDAPDTARLKGDTRMATLLARAVKDRQRIPQRDQKVRLDGVEFVVRVSDLAAARKDARATRKPHNQARSVFVRSALDRILVRYERALATRGLVVTPEESSERLDDLRRHPGIRKLLNLCWLPYTPQSFLNILFAHPERLHAADPSLTPGQVDLLARPKGSPWTVDDVPLLDEAAEILGEDDEVERVLNARAHAQREQNLDYARGVLANIDTDGLVRAEDLADRMEVRTGLRSIAERALEDRQWTFGHVVADEAQELSAMAWRVLMRRCPTKSFTVVGDIAQTSSAAGADRWGAALSPFVGDRYQLTELTVNYRTPRRIMDRAVETARQAGLHVTQVQSVRNGDHDVATHRVEPEAISSLCARLIMGHLRADQGRVAVICPSQTAQSLQATLTSVLLHDPCRGSQEQGTSRALLGDRIGLGSGGIDDIVAVMTAEQAKGLEFDDVIIVEPAQILRAHRRGANDLYVAMTRSTRRLDIVHSEDLPAGICATHKPQQ
ncbi:HelD family protein [Devriesea agamarum]|uniref:HelD family protein n=1 Tax=Devriesea agamarum TaxID=472569 RepID=UPI00071DBF1E|nr:AAA family ATPase [Devriesea agamarum]